MNIDFNDQGVIATVTITSTIFEFRRHVRIVDATLICTPGTVAKHSGFFLMKTVISGPTNKVLRAHKTAQREASR